MALSKASCTGRGLIPAIGGHVHRMFDEGEDDLFSLSLDDVMDDRPWTADELMAAGLARQAPIPHLRLSPHLRRLLRSRLFRRPRLRPHPFRRPRPLPAPQATRPRRRHFSLRRRGANRPTAPLCTAPSSCPFLRHASLRSQSSMSPLPIRLPTIPGLQLIWMRPLPACRALDVPVNPLFAANTSAADYEGGAAYSDYSDSYTGTGRIETEDYGTASSDYLNDPYAATPAPEYDPDAAPAPAYTKSTAKSASPIITPRKRRCVSRNFRRQSRLPLSPLSLPCSASLRLRDSGCSPAPPKRSRRPSKKRTMTSIWTSTPSRATPTTETTSSEG